MSVRVVRWEGSERPSESSLRQMLRDEGLDAYLWSNGPGDLYSPHFHAYSKVIYVVTGSITFGLPDLGQSIELEPGDCLELPAGVRHDAAVGKRGVSCLEAHREV